MTTSGPVYASQSLQERAASGGEMSATETGVPVAVGRRGGGIPEASPSEIEQVTDRARAIASPDVELSPRIPLWFYILVDAEQLGREASPGYFESGEGFGPVGARIVAEILYGLVGLDDWSYFGQNRSWDPDEGVGVGTLGEC